MEPFARTIDATKEYVVSSRVEWKAELVRRDPGQAVRQLKREPGRGTSWEECSFRWRWRSWD